MMGMAFISISGAVLFVDFGGTGGGHSSPWLLILGFWGWDISRDSQ